MRTRIHIALVVSMVACACGCSPRPRQAVLVTIDSLRDDHVGPQRGRASLTPALDRLHSDAVRYTDTLASATTTMASHASMLTGLRPHRHGLGGNDGVLDPGLPALATLLRGRGVRTAAVVSSYVLRSQGGGLAAGFETYDETFDQREQVRQGQLVKSPAAATRAALDWIRQHRGDSFLLWVHYFPPHGPYTPPPGFLPERSGAASHPLVVSAGNYERGKIPRYQQLDGVTDAEAYRQRYAGHVRYVDQHVGVLLDGLRELGVYDRALILATADHGESLGEHDWYFCHGNLVYQEQARVPLVVKWPRSLGRSGRDIASPAELVDVMPTMLRFFDVQPPADLDGRDLAGLLSASGGSSDRVRITQSSDGELTAVTLGPMKLTERRGPARLVGDSHPRQELFRLDRDPGEAHERAVLEPEMVKTLTSLMPRCRRPVRQQGLSGESRQRLENLGYLVGEAGAEPCAPLVEASPRPR